MTVCIAAITLNGEIVTVSDTMIHGLMSSADKNTVKMTTLAKDWNVMWAADDITQCIPIVQRAEKYFTNRGNTLQVVRSSLKRAYQQHLAEFRADHILGGFGMDMRMFLNTKTSRFSEAESETLMSRLWKFKLVHYQRVSTLGFCPAPFYNAYPRSRCFREGAGFGASQRRLRAAREFTSVLTVS